MIRPIVTACVIVLSICASTGVSAQTVRKELDLALARRVAAAALDEARRLDAGGAIAVVDSGGALVHLERIDRTFPAAAEVATQKARTAATFRRPTRDFENAIKGGRASLLGVQVMTPLQGGVPIVGAVGVSGAASAQQDDDIASAAVRTLQMSAAPAAGATAPVRFLAAAPVAEAFSKGAPLIETPAYKIHASRREMPGQAEVHDADTDIVYVLDGSATLVTGGTVVDGKTVAANERRGASIRGGESRRLARGDVIVAPNGVPHQFQEVQAPFLYYVVKVSDGTGGTR